MSEKTVDGYKEQDGCHNCHFVEAIEEHDDLTQYFCGYEAPKRPRSGSVYMGEAFAKKFSESSKVIIPRMRAWEEWTQGRQVKSYGICDYFKKGVEDGGKETNS